MTEHRPPRLSLRLRTAAGLFALALFSAGCVSETANLLPDEPPIATDPAIYGARSDGNFTIPALPVDQIPEAYRRQVVDYVSDQAPGTIIIDPSQKLLYYILGKDKALRYGIAVGRAGFQWSGEAIVANKKYWPTWTPPKEMIARDPKLSRWEKGQPGGPTNPLGARAIYLTSGGVDYGYRIHGTPEWRTIGRNASSGCIRMINQDVIDLFDRVDGGNKVIVLTAKGEMPRGLSIPKPPAVKKPAPAAAPATAVATREGPPPSGFTPAAAADAAALPVSTGDATGRSGEASGTVAGTAPQGTHETDAATAGTSAAPAATPAGDEAPATDPSVTRPPSTALCADGATGPGCPPA